MSDVVHALGYETLYMNINKPGREIDIHARHRLENRSIVVECKAHNRPISGSDLNKFAGILESERVKDPGISGYFISISGFTAPARLQESEFPRPRFLLLGPDEIYKQLIAGRILVTREQAVFSAANFLEADNNLSISEKPVLVAHQSGWLWLIEFTKFGITVGFSLVHASGHLVPTSAAESIKSSLPEEFRTIKIYAPRDPEEWGNEDAFSAYAQYVLQECGSITLEGMPVDNYASTARHDVEAFYIDITLEKMPTHLEERPQGNLASRGPREEVRVERLGEILTVEKKIAVLAPPGSGKSTLIKRLAVAYLDPHRRSLIDDDLPSEPWMPIVIRGRDLKISEQTTILGLIHDIPRKAEFPQLDNSFRRLVNETMRAGKALLLIDGIDEIADETARRRFTTQLRTFLAIYPSVRLVLTSREAGFRVVATDINYCCVVYRLSELTDANIYKLTHAWYAHVDPTPRGKDYIDQVVNRITDNSRVRRLAENPLLLTTLLYVQRWIGDMPKRRIILYDKAIELLLMTWNVEGHTPLNLDEVVPQLSYLAFKMTIQGEQRASYHDMEKTFLEARKEMPEVLAYVSTTAGEVIRRVELRSSLLVKAGHTIEAGRLLTSYEFRHLTFQEYLTARAIANDWIPASMDRDPVELLKQHFSDPNWSEVIVLCSTLLGRKGAELIKALVAYVNEMISSQEEENNTSDRIDTLVHVLLSCISDEAQAFPEDAEDAIDLALHFSYYTLGMYQDILTGRYGDTAKSLIIQQLSDRDAEYLIKYFQVAADVFAHETNGLDSSGISQLLTNRLQSSSLAEQLCAISFLFSLSYHLDVNDNLPISFFGGRDAVFQYVSGNVEHVCNFLIESKDEEHLVLCLIWALAWMTETVTLPDSVLLDTASTLIFWVLNKPLSQQGWFSGWVLSNIHGQLKNFGDKLLSEIDIAIIQACLRRKDKLPEFAAMGISALAIIADCIDKDIIRNYIDSVSDAADERWDKIRGSVSSS
ncbi:hypothetical protein CA984_03460 [Streptosporangium minutum]|uniref:NACHT domain-containing protein n=2 Tax=Streptosporangium minutum TaxID=569862 RepID=A0A243RW08_9ACTN|nr:hypothetical protein CA984_03460 [Streptosporangium minutum]